MQEIPFRLVMVLTLHEFRFGLYGEVEQAGPVAKSGIGSLQPNETNALQAEEEKVYHIKKVKANLEQTLAELEHHLDQENKLCGGSGEAERKFKGEAELIQKAVADLGRNKRAPEQTIQLKTNENLALTATVDDEQSLVSKLQKQIRELEARIEELEEELEAERQ